MIIALDYDGTYTADPVLWKKFLIDCNIAGHICYIVTMRRPDEAIEDEYLFQVHYTSRKAKRPYMEALGIIVDIWIDDNPHWVNRDAF